MPRGGGNTYQPGGNEAREQLREYSPDELAEHITKDDMLAANSYQLENPVEALLENPLPIEFRQRNQLGWVMLVGNTIDYDSVAEGVEDIIAEDEKMKEILRLPNEGRRGELLRSRRSIVGFLVVKHSASKPEVA